MIPCARCVAALLPVLTLLNWPSAVVPADENRPNVVLVMVDDLGYSDIGCYGAEIETPNLDELASNGLRFTQFYNTARCWPTRAALLTGFYPQQVRRDALPGLDGGGGNRFQRPLWARLLPDMLKSAGYRSYHSGKWHIDGMPLASGFDRSYYLKDQSRFFSPQVHWEDDRKLPAVKRDSGFYGTTAIADHAVKCLTDHAQNHRESPFFHYLAFTAPHFPLHALPEDIARYQDRYMRDWAVVRSERWMRQQKTGLLTGTLSAVERDLGPPYDFPDHLKILGADEVNRPLPWKQLTESQQRFQANKMAIHAAMIDRVDQELGRVVQQLRRMNQFENTLILFLSDNGCSAEIMVRGDGHDPDAAPGSADTHLCLGPGWSTTCNTPFRRHKTWVHEGGISTPLVVHWPMGIGDRNGIRQNPGHVVDIVPTILECCRVQPLQSWGDSIIPTAPGTSLVPAFSTDLSVSHDYLWWLHEGNRAIRVGDMKLVAAKGEPWELYDLAVDRAEQHDLAASQPNDVQRLEALWNRRVEEFRELARSDGSLPEQR